MPENTIKRAVHAAQTVLKLRGDIHLATARGDSKLESLLAARVEAESELISSLADLLVAMVPQVANV